MNNSARFWIVVALLSLGFIGLMVRLVDLGLLKRTFLVKQGQMRTVRTVEIPAYRGMIMDRNGNPLAMSTPVDSIWANPQSFHPTSLQQQQLAKNLGLTTTAIQNQLSHAQSRRFMYLKRRIDPQVSKIIADLKIPGVYLQREYKRYYPEGEVTAHLVGLTNIDDHGQEGLELSYDAYLSGKPGKKQVIKDRLGHIIAQTALLKEPEQGHPLTLSIDRSIQYAAYQELKKAVERYQAEGGSIVVLDAHTSEVLAMVNQPSYNPNAHSGAHDDRYRNRAVTDMFEPGSTIKPFTIALALNSGQYTVDSVIDTNPGWIKVGGYRINDDGQYGILNLNQILEKSSNIGAAKIMLSLSPQSHWDLLHRLGFGELTQSQFPGEVPGRLVAHTQWRPSVVATMAYGYGIAVTALQLAQAYAVFANHGWLKPVSLTVSKKPVTAQTQVLSSTVSDQVLSMLENVVQNGTGQLAQVPGYRVAGKTGTAYIAGPHGYDKKHYVSSFVGIAPSDQPRFVIAVVIRDPQGRHFGAEVAAPVFAQVMGSCLRIKGK